MKDAEKRFGLKGDGVDDEATAGSAALPRRASNTPGSETPPPMKIASGAGSPQSASGARPMTISRPVAPRWSALRRARSAALGAFFQSDAAVARMTQAPFDADRAGPVPMSHRSSPARGAERCEGQGADLGLW